MMAQGWGDKACKFPRYYPNTYGRARPLKRVPSWCCFVISALGPQRVRRLWVFGSISKPNDHDSLGFLVTLGWGGGRGRGRGTEVLEEVDGLDYSLTKPTHHTD